MKDTEAIASAKAADLAFIIKRHEIDCKPSWTIFNQFIDQTDQEETSVDFFPIINAPAHEIDTLNTVVQRCMYVSSKPNQSYTVITVDQALYYRLIQLKFVVPEYKEKLIVRLGGLHISMNFLGVIGNHMSGSGLTEAWIESNLLGPLKAEKAMYMSGKEYNKAVRAHKLTYQALWRLLYPQFYQFLETQDPLLAENLRLVHSLEVEGLMTTVSSDAFQSLFNRFLTEKIVGNVNNEFWWNYMEMISILLQFIRAQRVGNWDLHIESFTSMIKYFMRYHHHNYARWGPVYVTEMHQLPDEILELFRQDHFVVKRSRRKFNQVDPDQAQEWLNGTGKRGGDIVGITQTPNALARWSLSYNLRSQMSVQISFLFGIEDDNEVHNEERFGRNTRDNMDEDNLFKILQRFNVFSVTEEENDLTNIATKDIATDRIKESLLNAGNLGQLQLESFVKERLLTDINDNQSALKPLNEPLERNKAETFSNLYDIEKKNAITDKGTHLKADRNVMQRLVCAYASRRPVDLSNIVQHELMSVPISLAETSGSLRTGNKALLAECLTETVYCPSR